MNANTWLQRLPYTGCALILFFGLAENSAIAVNLIQMGDSLNLERTHHGQSPCMAVNQGLPYVAWNETGDVGSRIFVKHWNGSAWEQDGTLLNNHGEQWAEEPSLAFAGTTVHAAWCESTGRSYQIHVKRLEGTGWQPVGGALALNREPERSARHPRLASHGTRIFAAWSEDNGFAGQIYVRYSDGGSWLDMGNSLNCDPEVSAGHPSLAVSEDGRLICVAWDEGGDIFVKQWNGIGWELAGNGRLNTYPASAPSLAINSGRIPCVAWVENHATAGQIYVKFLAGGNWQPLGGSLNLDPLRPAHGPALACVAGTTQVAWVEDNQVYLKRLQGTRWQLEGKSQNILWNRPALSPSLALSAGREPYLAWVEDNGLAQQVWVKKWPQAPLVTRLMAPGTRVYSAFPAFEVSGINDYESLMQYRIEISSVPDFASILRRFDQTLCGLYWSAGSYHSGAGARYAMQLADNALGAGQYYWRAYAYDMTYAIWSSPSAAGAFQIESVAYPAPDVRSGSHPVPGQWYTARQADFCWPSHPQAGQGRYLLNADPAGQPQAAGATITASSIALWVPGDGVWYFHLCLQDAADPPNYGATAHFALRVDATAPCVQSVNHEPSGEKGFRVSWSAQDAAKNGVVSSGISGYSYVLDRRADTIPPAEQNCSSATTIMESGSLAEGLWYFHIRACDQAGNWSDTFTCPLRLACRLLPTEQVRCIPNPVRSNRARIRYYLREPAQVRLEIFTAMERRVSISEQTQPAEGTYTVSWEPGSLPNGIYFYRLQARSLAHGEQDQVVEKIAVAR